MSKVEDDHQCAMWVFAMRAILMQQRLGYQMIANGFPRRHAVVHAVVHFEVKMSRFLPFFEDK